MTQRRVAYIRTSPADGPDDLHQLAWADVAETYQEEVGPNDHRRPQRGAALAALQRGDTLVVQSMERLARDSDELHGLLVDLNDRGVTAEFITEGITFSPQDRLALDRELALLAAGQGFVRAANAERQRAGINKVKQQKRKYNGAKLKLNEAQMASMRMRLAALPRRPKDSITAIARDFGISRETVYRYERAGDPLVVAAARAARAKRQRGRGDVELAERTMNDAIVKRRAAIASTKGLGIAKVRRARAEAEAAERALNEGDATEASGEP